MPFASTALRVVAVLLASISSSSITFGSESHFVGHWEGTLVREGIPLKVSFDVAEPHVHFRESKSHGLSARRVYRRR
jgi:hypothetical protein